MPGHAQTFGWGIVGTGHIAHRFAADLAYAGGSRVAAVCSRDPGRAARFATECSAEAFSELSAFLASPGLDAVYVATPNTAHLDGTLAAIRAGKPVLTEKPLALDAAQARQIREEAERAGVFATEAMWTRFLPAVQAAKRKLDAGEIGRITRITADLSFRRTEKHGQRFFDPGLGGGAALDLGVYPVSLAIGFLGLPQQVSGRWWAAPSGVDMRAEFRLGYPGASAVLSCGFDRDGENAFLVEGTEGALRLAPPFINARRLTRFGAGTLASPVGRLARAGGWLGKAMRRLPLPGVAVERHDFPGSGLQFPAMAVMEAVRRGDTASSVMPLAESEAVLAVIGTVLARPAEA